MKLTVCLLGAVLTVSSVGCNQPSPFEPDALAGRASRKERPGDIILPVRVIHVNVVVPEPGGRNAFVWIRGAVTWSATLYPRDPMPEVPQWQLIVASGVDLKLMPFGMEEPVWQVSESSESGFGLMDSDETVTFARTLAVRGRTDGLIVRIHLLASARTVELISVGLEVSGVEGNRDRAN